MVANEEISPVCRVIPKLLEALRDDRVVVLRAPPGAGKTTEVPPAISDGLGQSSKRVLLIQPRRLAARAAAVRLSAIRGCRVGDEVGYQVRFDRKESDKTRIISMTTGILLRRFTDDPFLEDVSCVILDEFHERSLEIDLVLGMICRLRESVRPDLRLVIMSATMDSQPLVNLIPDSRAIDSAGRTYEVEIHYAGQTSRRPIDQQILEVVPEALAETSGHVLVFLPGVGEIHLTAQTLARAGIGHEVTVDKLYGDMNPNQQDAVLNHSSSRKLILATNVAETSITIPGVTAVIDSGLAKVLRQDQRVGMSELRLENISQASADQRAGRAGRTGPGHCWRLWTSGAHRARPAQPTPEIMRADFATAALTLSHWGEKQWETFPWVTKPDPRTLDSAESLLLRLGAISTGRVITELGKSMAQLPAHPRVARMLLESDRFGVTRWAAIGASVLSERSAFDRAAVRRGVRRDRVSAHSCDLLEKVLRLEEFNVHGDDDHLIAGAARNVLRVADQLARLVNKHGSKTGLSANQSNHDVGPEEGFARSLVVAFPDRVARRRNPGSKRGLMVGGRGVSLDSDSGVIDSELFLCLDADGAGKEARIRMASTVKPEWLPQSMKNDRVEVLFHSSRQSVVARRRVYFDDLLLSDSPTQCESSEEVDELLFQNARSNLDSVMPTDHDGFSSFVQRAGFLSEHLSSSEFPTFDDQLLIDVLKELCSGRISFQQLRDAPWLDHLRGRYSFEELQLLDREAPERIQVPSGNHLRVRYERNRPPVLAVRIQEIFGWSDAPRIAMGRTSLQLHLLGPNHRPQQITDDLQSFWSTTYAQVRKDLRGRYPKHHWPEDPVGASATRNGLKPRN